MYQIILQFMHGLTVLACTSVHEEEGKTAKGNFIPCSLESTDNVHA